MGTRCWIVLLEGRDEQDPFFLQIKEADRSVLEDQLPASVGTNLAAMKVRHLLTMTTGHADDTMPALRESSGAWPRAFLELGVGFNPELPAQENVVMNAVMMGLSSREAGYRCEQIIDFAGLHDYTDLKLKNYSSGMRVRLGLADGHGVAVTLNQRWSSAAHSHLRLHSLAWDGVYRCGADCVPVFAVLA